MDPEVKNLHLRAISLADKFKQGGGPNCIEEAINLDREALELCSPSDPTRPASLACLAIHLCDRYGQLGEMEDLAEAIVLNREGLSLRLKGHTARSMSLENLASTLITRYNKLGDMEDVNEAITLNREALDLRPQGHPDRPMSLSNVASNLIARYGQFGAVEDLDEAISLGREGLDLQPQGHRTRPTMLNNLALYLAVRYRRLGSREDLDLAIVLDREALGLRQRGDPDRLMSLQNLAIHLLERYEQLGVTEDLDEAIALNREALGLCPKGHPERSGPLNSLATNLSARHDRLGITKDLDEAIVLNRESLSLRPKGHPDRSISLNNLAAHLSDRYGLLDIIEDLDEAIVLNREALDLRPEGHPHRSTSLNNLANALRSRYERLGAIEDLHEAVLLSRVALDICQEQHPLRPSSLDSLARSLFSRYKKLGGVEDLDEAIELVREAFRLQPSGNPQIPNSLTRLAVYLSARYHQGGEMVNIDAAIFVGQLALALRPPGHPHRSITLNNLANNLYDRFAKLRQPEDINEMFGLYAELEHSPHTLSLSDLSTARTWVSAAEWFQHPTILLAYEASLRLFVQHVANLPSLPQHLPILKNLSSSLAVDAFSACLRNRSLCKAVELLEQGRGVFWSQRTRLHSPLDDVAASGMPGRELAGEFTRITSLIRNAFDSTGVNQHELLCHLNIQMQSVVNNIRALPGFSRFLLPPVFSDLQQAASGGPVIIVNASVYSCDALVILLDRDPIHIPLQVTRDYVQDLSRELRILTAQVTRADMTKELAAFLRRLWDHIASPIVDFLGTTCPPQSRIWWCPTGEFSALPLHAAAPYRKGQRKLADLYISSYTPTLTALIRARQCDPSSPTVLKRRFVAIGQGKTAGQRELPSVGTELDSIHKLISKVATFTRIDGGEASMSRVVEALGKNEWVHFSCHGLPNRTQPFESAFALHDGRFTIHQLLGCDLKNPEFAYLSACHTTVGDEESPDEVIHLASAMQFIGFRSVIGTMWAVDDGETNAITSTFYAHMVDASGRLDHTRAALALHRTMKSVRVPLDQRILYIHLGA